MQVIFFGVILTSFILNCCSIYLLATYIKKIPQNKKKVFRGLLFQNLAMFISPMMLLLFPKIDGYTSGLVVFLEFLLSVGGFFMILFISSIPTGIYSMLIIEDLTKKKKMRLFKYKFIYYLELIISSFFSILLGIGFVRILFYLIIRVAIGKFTSSSIKKYIAQSMVNVQNKE